MNGGNLYKSFTMLGFIGTDEFCGNTTLLQMVT